MPSARHLIRILLPLLVLFSGPIACSSSSKAKKAQSANAAAAQQSLDPTFEAQESFLRGNKALDERNWELALMHYDRAVEFDPQRWDIHMNRALALMSMQRFQEATDAFADALEQGGDHEPVLLFNLGNFYQDRGRYEIAIDAYRTSMARHGELDYDTMLNIAACFTFLHSYDDAQQTIERAIEMRPDDPRAYLSLGLIQFAKEEPNRALDTYQTLLASYPDFAPAYYNRGYILMRLRRYEEAQQTIEHYLKIDPDGPYTNQAQHLLNQIERRL